MDDAKANPPGHRVTLQPSARVLEVAEDRSVLAAALDAGVILPYSCRGGSCGSCRARLLSGHVGYPHDLRPVGLSEAEEAAGYTLLCQARPLSELVVEAQEVKAPADVEIRRLPVRVEHMERLNHDVMALYLRLPAVQRLQFSAGQYVDILLGDGRRRSFSLANPPEDDELLELHVRLVPDGQFTTYVFQEMHEKALLRIEGPLGTFFLRDDLSRPKLFVAGGTGFAPIKGVLRHAFHVGVREPMSLYWGVRDARDLYQRELVETWTREHDGFDFTPVASEPGADWSGRSGWVHEAVLADHPELSGYDVYTCGPPPMIAAVREAFLTAGLPEERLFYDSFDFAPETQRALADKT